VSNLKIGDRVVVPFTISCGQCWFCQKGLFSACDRTNPNAELAAKAMGQSPAGLFGFSHMMGGYSGGQADYLRVPMADIGPIKIPDSVTDEQALSCPTSSPPATWRPRTRRSSRAIPWPSGAADRSASLPFARR
jgi:threonine dehydrogenase-like Zn-dependent dehydrogenase